MKKQNNSIKNPPKHDTKKEMMIFLDKAKKTAKANGISYDMRAENYTNKNKEIYTYGIR